MSGSEKGGLAAALAYGVFSTTFIPQDMLAANCEVLMMLPLTLSALFLHKGLQKQKWSLFFLSGIMIGLGVLIKYQGGILLMASIGYLLVSPFINPAKEKLSHIKKSITRSLILSAGFLIPLIAIATYLHFREALPHAIETFKYIVLYAAGPVQSDGLYVFLKFVFRTIIFALPTLPIWIGSIYIIYRALKGKFKDPAIPPFSLMIIFWFFLAFVPIVMGGRIYFHYYYIVLPAAAALTGIWWAIKNTTIKPAFKYLLIGWMIICAAGWSWFAVHQAQRGHGKKETWVKTANYLKEIRKPGDTLFVWGLCYQLYFFSGMETGTRFTSADYLTGRSPMTAGLEFDPNMANPPSSFGKLRNDFVDKYYEVVHFDTSHNIFPPAWKYLEEDFNKELPTYIVDTSPSNYRRYARYPISKFPYLDNVIKTHYTKLQDINGYIVYKLSGTGS
jgi:4-amino-4-deoxy-L-arabinose transferase-like glycosyltransferase